MDYKTVLVTGIGGNVGQGILRNVRSSGYNVRIIGCDIANFTSGNYLCDKTYQVPYSYDENYIPVMQDIITSEKVDLVIPSTDYEVFYLSSAKDRLNAFVLACDAGIAHKFLDKYETFLLFREAGIPFAQSWLPRNYDFSQQDIIAKPREGRGSRGILVNPADISGLGDDYMIQTMYKGIEITTAIYVDKNAEIYGIFSMERKLENGTTSRTIVNDTYDAEFLEIVQSIVSLGGIRGSINLQSIVDEKGGIHPFEVNCRISGTNSIRHCLGFKDVVYGLQEYLYGEAPEKVAITKGIATRVLLDVVYPDATSFESLNNSASNHIVY